MLKVPAPLAGARHGPAGECPPGWARSARRLAGAGPGGQDLRLAGPWEEGGANGVGQGYSQPTATVSPDGTQKAGCSSKAGKLGRTPAQPSLEHAEFKRASSKPGGKARGFVGRRSPSFLLLGIEAEREQLQREEGALRDVRAVGLRVNGEAPALEEPPQLLAPLRRVLDQHPLKRERLLGGASPATSRR